MVRDGFHHTASGYIFIKVLIQRAFVRGDILYGDVFQVAVDCCIQNGNLLFYRDWAVAVLLQDFHNALALCQTRFGVGIQVGAKLGKALQLAVLGVNQF